MIYIDTETGYMVQRRLIVEEDKIVEIVSPKALPQMATVLYNKKYDMVNHQELEMKEAFQIIHISNEISSQNDSILVTEIKRNRETVRKLESCNIILAGGLGLEKRKF